MTGAVPLHLMTRVTELVLGLKGADVGDAGDRRLVVLLHLDMQQPLDWEVCAMES